MKQKNALVRACLLPAVILLLLACGDDRNYDWPQRPADPDLIDPEYSPCLFHLAYENDVVDLGNYMLTSSGTGPVGYVPGVQGKAYWSNGVTGYATVALTSEKTTVNLNDTLSKIGSFTCGGWLKPALPEALGTRYGIASVASTGQIWGNFDLFAQYAGAPEAFVMQFGIWLRNGTGDAAADFFTNQNDPYYVSPAVPPQMTAIWTHYMFRYDGASSKMALFLNGAKADEKVVTLLDGSPMGKLAWKTVAGAPMTVGGYSFGTTYNGTGIVACYQGGIDEWRMFRVPLSDADILAIYNDEKP